MWWWRAPHNPTAYDDDWEDQPAQSGFHQWGLGVVLPLFIGAYGLHALHTRHVRLGRPVFELHGTNATALGIAVLGAAIFLHCHYYWGNIYNQAWFAVLGKIISACAFIGGLGTLLVRVGVFGRG